MQRSLQAQRVDPRRRLAQLGQQCGQLAARPAGQRRRSTGPGRARLEPQRRQQPRQQGIGPIGVAGAGADAHAACPAVQELGQQPRLAHAGCALDDHGLAPVPGVLQRLPGGIAADQRRAALQPRRQRQRRPRPALVRALAQLRGQAGGLVVRQLPQFGVQPLGETAVGVECRTQVPAPVVQSHQPPVGVVGKRLVGAQPLGDGQRRGHAGLRLEPAGQPRQRLAAHHVPALARQGQPALELRAVGVGQAVEQLAVQRRRVVGEPAFGLVHAGCDAAGQAQRVFALDQRPAGRPRQPEAALAQAGAGTRQIDRGPEHLRQGVACGLAVQRQHGQQRRVLAAQRQAGDTGPSQRRGAQQVDLGIGRGRGGRRRRGLHQAVRRLTPGSSQA
jgi:hypothetical protein